MVETLEPAESPQEGKKIELPLDKTENVQPIIQHVEKKQETTESFPKLAFDASKIVTPFKQELMVTGYSERTTKMYVLYLQKFFES